LTTNLPTTWRTSPGYTRESPYSVVKDPSESIARTCRLSSSRRGPPWWR